MKSWQVSRRQTIDMRSTVLNYGSLATIVHVTNPAVYDEKKYSETSPREETVPLLSDRDQRTLARMVRDYVDGVACRCANHGCLDCHG